MRPGVLFSSFILLVLFSSQASSQQNWDCEVFQAERETIIDPTSGARLVFVTRSPAEDTNLYFHQRSWLPDGSVLVFRTNRGGKQELFGYIEATGELFRLQRPGLALTGDTTAGRFSNSVFVLHDKQAFEWSIKVAGGTTGSPAPSHVTVSERPLGKLPADSDQVSGLTENSDGTALVFGFSSTGPMKFRIVSLDKRSGNSTQIAALDVAATHVQASWERPDLVMYASGGRVADRAKDVKPGEISARIWLADKSHSDPWPLYQQEEGELVTHECWWVGDQVTFCSGQLLKDGGEEAHVKVIDVQTGITRIIGAGAWWPNGHDYEISKRNWWHSSGAPSGKFVAGDNWHGDIGIFSGKTSRTRILTENHRTYGKGAHPHVGWNPLGTSVVFTSNRNGNPDVCIGYLPEEWLKSEW
jgi:hypothetical protein